MIVGLFHKAGGPFTCRDLHVPPAAGVEGNGIVGIFMNICGPIFVALTHVLSEVSVPLDNRVVWSVWVCGQSHNNA